MTFDVWKKQIIRLAKRERKGYLVPSVDTLRISYEKGKTPSEVWQAMLSVRISRK